MFSPRIPRHHPALALALLGATLSLAFGQTSTLTFAVFGDSQPGGKQVSPVLNRLAADMAAARPAFVIGTGDYVDGASDPRQLQRQYSGFFRALAPLQAYGPVPVALAPGNHDILGSRANKANFCRYFGATYYSFNRAGCHFIILSSEEPGEDGRIAGKQWNWLVADLDRNAAAKLTFVAVHEPLFPVSIHRGSSLDAHPKDRDALHRLFVRRGVDCVFHGHEHLFNRRRRDGVDYIITGGAGGSLYAKEPAGGFHHYVLVRVNRGKYRVDVRRL